MLRYPLEQRNQTPLYQYLYECLKADIVTCSRHLTKNHPLDNFLQEVGASCSSQTILTVSTGYPREPHGFFFIPSKHPLTHVPDRTELDFVC